MEFDHLEGVPQPDPQGTKTITIVINQLLNGMILQVGRNKLRWVKKVVHHLFGSHLVCVLFLSMFFASTKRIFIKIYAAFIYRGHILKLTVRNVRR